MAKNRAGQGERARSATARLFLGTVRYSNGTGGWYTANMWLTITAQEADIIDAVGQVARAGEAIPPMGEQRDFEWDRGRATVEIDQAAPQEAPEGEVEQ